VDGIRLGRALVLTVAVAAASYVALMLGCYAHEILGHGGVAILAGGRFEAFVVSPDAHGWARYTDVAAGRAWLPLWGGIGVNLLTGALAGLLLRFATVRGGHLRLFLTALAATSTGQALGYALLGALSGDGDAAALSRDLHGLAHAGVVAGLALGYLATVGWALGHVVPLIERQFDATTPRDRRRGFLGTIVVPLAAMAALRPASAVFRPGLDWASRGGVVLVVAVLGFAVCGAVPSHVSTRDRLHARGALLWVAAAAALALFASTVTEGGLVLRG
jgi:hypothetical protein